MRTSAGDHVDRRYRSSRGIKIQNVLIILPHFLLATDACVAENSTPKLTCWDSGRRKGSGLLRRSARMSVTGNADLSIWEGLSLTI